MKILYLAHRIPFPPNKGDKIRSYHELRYLAQHHEVDVLCLADEPDDLKYAADLAELCGRVSVYPLHKTLAKLRGALSLTVGKTISVGYFYQKNLQRCFDRWLQEKSYDAILCFSSTMAEYVFRSKFYVSSTWNLAAKLIMDFCDVDSDKWTQYAAEAVFPLNQVYALENRRLLDYESCINRQFDQSVFATQNEADLFASLFPGRQHCYVIQNGVDSAYFDPAAQFQRVTKTAPTLVFTGAMDYHANVDGVQWFCREIWPQIRQQLPDCQFYIVGSKPSPVVRSLAEVPGVFVTGFVDDIRSYYALADVCVVPLRFARGIQNKALEAMAMSKAVVTTSKVAAGLGAKAGEQLLIADDSDSFARKVLSLLGQQGQRNRLAANARLFIEEQFNWDKNMSVLNRLLES